jgi:hypothetical protein
MPVKRPLWLRLLLVLAIGVLYLTAIRPARAVFMTFTMQAVDVEALEKQGYTIAQPTAVQRTFTKADFPKRYQYKAPFDSFFAFSLMFAIFYGIQFSWLRSTTVIHLVLWFLAYATLLLSPNTPVILAIVDAISYYINPVLTLSIIPVWIFSTKRRT